MDYVLKDVSGTLSQHWDADEQTKAMKATEALREELKTKAAALATAAAELAQMNDSWTTEAIHDALQANDNDVDAAVNALLDNTTEIGEPDEDAARHGECSRDNENVRQLQETNPGWTIDRIRTALATHGNVVDSAALSLMDQDQQQQDRALSIQLRQRDTAPARPQATPRTSSDDNQTIANSTRLDSQGGSEPSQDEHPPMQPRVKSEHTPSRDEHPPIQTRVKSEHELPQDEHPSTQSAIKPKTTTPRDEGQPPRPRAKPESTKPSSAGRQTRSRRVDTPPTSRRHTRQTTQETKHRAVRSSNDPEVHAALNHIARVETMYKHERVQFATVLRDLARLIQVIHEIQPPTEGRCVVSQPMTAAITRINESCAVPYLPSPDILFGHPYQLFDPMLTSFTEDYSNRYHRNTSARVTFSDTFATYVRCFTTLWARQGCATLDPEAPMATDEEASATLAMLTETYPRHLNPHIAALSDMDTDAPQEPSTSAATANSRTQHRESPFAILLRMWGNHSHGKRQRAADAVPSSVRTGVHGCNVTDQSRRTKAKANTPDDDKDNADHTSCGGVSTPRRDELIPDSDPHSSAPSHGLASSKPLGAPPPVQEDFSSDDADHDNGTAYVCIVVPASGSCVHTPTHLASWPVVTHTNSHLTSIRASFAPPIDVATPQVHPELNHDEHSDPMETPCLLQPHLETQISQFQIDDWQHPVSTNFGVEPDADTRTPHDTHQVTPQVQTNVPGATPTHTQPGNYGVLSELQILTTLDCRDTTLPDLCTVVRDTEPDTVLNVPPTFDICLSVTRARHPTIDAHRPHSRVRLDSLTFVLRTMTHTYMRQARLLRLRTNYIILWLSGPAALARPCPTCRCPRQGPLFRPLPYKRQTCGGPHFVPIPSATQCALTPTPAQACTSAFR